MNYELEIVDVTDIQPAKIYHLYLSKYHYMKQHFHHNIELVYLIKGRFIAYVNAHNSYVEANSLFLINTDEIHYFEMLEDCEMITVLLSYDMLKKYDKNIDHFIFDLSLKKEQHASLKDTILLMDQCRKGNDPYRQIKVQEYLCHIYYSLFNDFKTKRQEYNIYTKRQLEQIQSLLDYIENHYQQAITIEQLCSISHYSSSYLCRYFKTICGMSIFQYIKQIRLKHAYIDVCQSKEDISLIAYKHGFSSSKAFIKAFKEVYHQSPGLYRKNIVNNCL